MPIFPLDIPVTQPKSHPYEALNDLVSSIEACNLVIEEQKASLRVLQDTQRAILRRAFFAAHDEGELRPLAQYLYFDGPKELGRDAIKDSLSLMMNGASVQHWLCEGYTCQATCADCQGNFSYQVKSFSDLKAFRTACRYSPKRPSMGYRCDSCDYARRHGNSEAWRKVKEESQRQLQHLRSMPYREYLYSAHWQDVRSKALQRARFRCQLCNVSAPLQVHHRSYEHRGEEQFHMTDVIALCAGCHKKHHDIHE